MSASTLGLQQVSPISAANHYFASAQFWEARAKSLQGIVDAQDAENASLRERLAVYEPPDQDEENDTSSAAD